MVFVLLLLFLRRLFDNPIECGAAEGYGAYARLAPSCSIIHMRYIHFCAAVQFVVAWDGRVCLFRPSFVSIAKLYTVSTPPRLCDYRSSGVRRRREWSIERWARARAKAVPVVARANRSLHVDTRFFFFVFWKAFPLPPHPPPPFDGDLYPRFVSKALPTSKKKKKKQ